MSVIHMHSVCIPFESRLARCPFYESMFVANSSIYLLASCCLLRQQGCHLVHSTMWSLLLSDGIRLLHMIVTTPDRVDTCYRNQVSIACTLLAWHIWLHLGIVYSLHCGSKAPLIAILLKKVRTTLLAQLPSIRSLQQRTNSQLVI